ncbi:MAG: dockerin type I domain-containing protein [Planctomycetota bacterium]
MNENSESRAQPRDPHAGSESLPEALQADLAALWADPATDGGGEQERLLRRQLRAELAKRCGARRRFAWARGGLVAASLLAAISVGLYFMPGSNLAPNAKPAAGPDQILADASLSPGQNVSSPLDRDGNGRVDIRDAYVLARSLRSADQGENLSVDLSADLNKNSSADLNGDGKVDRLDVELIAKAAVKLDDVEQGK